MRTTRVWAIAVWVAVMAMTNVGNASALNLSDYTSSKPKHRVLASKKNKRKYDPHRYSKDKHNHKVVYESI